MLVLAGAEHQVLDGFARILAFFEDEFHLFADGHLDAALAGESQGSAGGVYTLGDFAAQRCQDFGKLAAVTQFDAYGAVAGERAGAGENEVAEAGKSGQSFTPSSAGHGKAGDLGDATGDEGRDRVITQANANGNTGRDGDHVFER